MRETSYLEAPAGGALAEERDRSLVAASWLFAITVFTSALLLFWVQPMIARMLLPLLGGTPTVWNTCMVFFQATLLMGYAYAHFLTRHCSTAAQMFIHGTLLFVALAVLPMALPQNAAPWEANPFVWLLRTLAIVVGLPFFIVSTTGPLLQNWFNRVAPAKDPYALYAASNLGSLIALLGYPVLMEPLLRLREQTQLWGGIYMVFVVLVAVCALKLRRSSQTARPAASPHHAITFRRRGKWVLLAFIPSSLMLGVTTYLTTDIASIPLLWVIPLSLYLLTFILVFARKQFVSQTVLSKALPILAVALVFLLLTEVRNPAWLLIGLHLLFFFFAAMIAHGRLAADRPPPSQLTEFYLFLSIGGVLGGVFNALLAPMVFRTVIEYPLVLALACMARPASSKEPADWFWLWPAVIGAFTAVAAAVVPRVWIVSHQLTMLVIFGIPLLACYFLSKRSLRFGLGLCAVMLGAQCYTVLHGRTMHVERNFFGALRVTVDGTFRRLYHGTTVHGIQFTYRERKGEPLAYYHRSGPFGLAYTAYETRAVNPRVAAVGLGAGAIAAYAKEGQQWTFYEIDPAILRVAQNPRFFTYLAYATNAAVDYKLGDARLRLREAADGHYGLIICDAFSSDVPPLHLITREAMELYLSKLAPGGMLLFHISSRYLDFRPVLGNLADHFRLIAVSLNEAAVDPEAARNGKYASHWVALARRPEDLGQLLTDRRGAAVQPDSRIGLWTDDYSNLLRIFNWR